MAITVKEGLYKGKPILQFWSDDAKEGTYYDKAPVLSMGVKKLRMIVDHLPAVRGFLESYKDK